MFKLKKYLSEEYKERVAYSPEEYFQIVQLTKQLSILRRQYKSMPNDNLDVAIQHIHAVVRQFRTKFKEIPYYIYQFDYDRSKFHRRDKKRFSKISLSWSDQILGDNLTEHKLNFYKEIKTSAKETIQEARKLSRKPGAKVKEKHIEYSDGTGQTYRYTMIGNNIVGYHHDTPKAIYAIFIGRKARKALEPKRPQTNKNYLGIEIELYSKYDRMALAALFYEHDLHEVVCIQHDGSIQPTNSYHPNEVTLLIEESKYEEVITKVCEVLKIADARVNQSCGMHVHVDMRNRKVETIFANLVAAQPVLYAMNPKSRLDNRYCRKTESRVFKPTDRRDDRYKGINAEAYNKYCTLEVRIHSGTVNKDKIINWIKLILAVVNKSEEVKRSPRTFRTFIKAYDIDMDLARYIAERIEKFSTHQDEGEERAAA